MKQILKLGVAAVALSLASFANAGPITALHAHKGASGTVTASTAYLFSFDLTQAAYGYRAGFDTITSALLSISLKDSGPSNRNNPNDETFTFRVGPDGAFVFSGSTVPNAGATYGDFAILGTALDSLSRTGKLDVRVTATSGDFQFVRSTLVADVTLGTEPGAVPEPLSVTLLGIGLAGIAAARRKA